MKCSTCGKGGSFGNKTCTLCLERAKKNSAARYVLLKKAKLCKNCNAPTAIGIYCVECKSKQKNRLKEKIKNNLCVVCGKNNPTNGQKCLGCYTEYQQNKLAKKNRRLAEGKCAFCEDIRIHSTLCLSHYLKFTSKSHFGTVRYWCDLHEKFLDQNGICPYSGRKLVLGVDASLDHIVPKSRGGINEISNTQWVHLDVNFMKQSMLNEEFLCLIKDIYEFRLLRQSIYKLS